MNNTKVFLGEICKVDWGNTSLTKSAYIENGEAPSSFSKGEDGRIDHWEHDALTPVISAIGAQCGKLLPKEKFTAIKNTITLTPIEKNKKSYCPYFLYFLLLQFSCQEGLGSRSSQKETLKNFRSPSRNWKNSGASRQF